MNPEAPWKNHFLEIEKIWAFARRFPVKSLAGNSDWKTKEINTKGILGLYQPIKLRVLLMKTRSLVLDVILPTKKFPESLIGEIMFSRITEVGNRGKLQLVAFFANFGLSEVGFEEKITNYFVKSFYTNLKLSFETLMGELL